MATKVSLLAASASASHNKGSWEPARKQKKQTKPRVQHTQICPTTALRMLQNDCISVQYIGAAMTHRMVFNGSTDWFKYIQVPAAGSNRSKVEISFCDTEGGHLREAMTHVLTGGDFTAIKSIMRARAAKAGKTSCMETLRDTVDIRSLLCSRLSGLSDDSDSLRSRSLGFDSRFDSRSTTSYADSDVMSTSSEVSACSSNPFFKIQVEYEQECPHAHIPVTWAQRVAGTRRH